MKYVFVKKCDNEQIKAAFEELVKIQKEHQDALGHDEFVGFEKAHAWICQDFDLWKKCPVDMLEAMEGVYLAAVNKAEYFRCHISMMTAYVYEYEATNVFFFVPTNHTSAIFAQIEQACIAVASDMYNAKIKKSFDELRAKEHQAR